MNKDKKAQEKRHLRLVENYDLDDTVENQFEIGEPQFDDSAHTQKGKIKRFHEGSWTHPGVSGKSDDENWLNKKEYREQVDFTGYGPKGYERSDDRIYEEVCEALMRHREVDASNIGVFVSKGIVSLSGRVINRRMKKMAELLALDQPGVKDVRNELIVIRGTDDPKGPDSAKGKDLGIY
jgi:hypothetical protein